MLGERYSHDRSCIRTAVGAVQEDTSAGCSVILVVLPLQVSKHLVLQPHHYILITTQRRPPWPTNPPPRIRTPLQETHGLAIGPYNTPLPLRRPQLRQARWSGVSRAPRKPVLAIILPCDMGYDCAGRRLLVCYADKTERCEGSAVDCLQHILHDMC